MSAIPAKPNIVVVGSANIDLVATAPAIPQPGQTILGNRFATIPGGKGANQAVAAARLEVPTALVGRVGDDPFGTTLRANLQHANVNCDHLLTTPNTSTGVALIVVADSGENAICVAPGANACITPADVDAAADLIARARVCLVQLELPLATVLHTLALARAHAVETILDPAPAPGSAPPELFDVDILTPNESEAEQLLAANNTQSQSCAAPATHHESDAIVSQRDVATRLRARGARTVVLKRGQAGAYLLNDEHDLHVPAHNVNVVDTTAAGDAFTAALAAARAANLPLPEALRRANAAGACACTHLGAQPSLPTRQQLEALLAP